jgi:hypothetical protein
MRRFTIFLTLLAVTAAIGIPIALAQDGLWQNKGTKTMHMSARFWKWPVVISWKWNCQNAGIHEGFDLDAIDNDSPHLLKQFVHNNRHSGQGSHSWTHHGLKDFRFRVTAHTNCNWTVHWKSTEH